MTRDDINYYRKRAIEEQVAARETRSARARQRHDELAAAYDFRAAMIAQSADRPLHDEVGDRRIELA